MPACSAIHQMRLVYRRINKFMLWKRWNNCLFSIWITFSAKRIRYSARGVPIDNRSYPVKLNQWTKSANNNSSDRNLYIQNCFWRLFSKWIEKVTNIYLTYVILYNFFFNPISNVYKILQCSFNIHSYITMVAENDIHASNFLYLASIRTEN